MEYLIGIDIGTTSTKVLAYSEEGRELARRERSYPILSPHPGFQEQDPEEILAAVISGLASISDQMGGQPLAVALSCAMHGLIAMDDAGQPLTRCIIWADGRSQPQADRLRSEAAGAAIYRATGTPIHPMSPLCKIAWLKEEEPALFAAAARFVSVKEYLLFRLFGEYVIDYSLASATGLFDIRQKVWHIGALDWLGVEAGRFSQPVAPTHRLTGIDVTMARVCHLDAAVPWVIGASDGCLANLGAQVLDQGAAVVTIGTSGAIRQTRRGRLLEDGQERLFNYVLDEDYFICGGAVNTGAYLRQWFGERLLPGGSDGPLEELMAAAFRLAPGAGGLVALPYLLGERAPLWDSRAAAAVVGLRSHHGAAHLLRAFLEGVTFSIYHCGAAMEELGAPVTTIYANGGFTQSPDWVQMLADVFGCPVTIDNSSDAPARGAVVMALVALGRLPSLDAAAHFVHREKEYLPDGQRHRQYQELFAVYRDLYPLLRSAMHRLTDFGSFS